MRKPGFESGSGAGSGSVLTKNAGSGSVLRSIRIRNTGSEEDIDEALHSVADQRIKLLVHQI